MAVLRVRLSKKHEVMAMQRFLWQKADEGLLFLRVAFGLMMMVHGWGKLANFGQMAGSFPDPFGVGSGLSLSLAIFAELVCSILLLVGLGTRFALIPLMVTMLVAIFYAHGADPWAKKELAVAYLTVYGTLMLAGPGRFSLDRVLFGAKGS